VKHGERRADRARVAGARARVERVVRQGGVRAQDAGAQAPTATAPAAAPGAPVPNPRGRATALPIPFATFPVPGSVPVTLHPTAGGRGIASLAFAPVAAGSESLTDDVAFSGSALASMPTSAHRLLYATPVFTDTVHISGTPRVTLRMAASVKAANLSVWLVMLPYDSARAGSQSYKGNVSHGWADLQNAKALECWGPTDERVSRLTQAFQQSLPPLSAQDVARRDRIMREKKQRDAQNGWAEAGEGDTAAGGDEYICPALVTRA
jgi:hypothetical protein